jgi:hypothetical protein
MKQSIVFLILLSGIAYNAWSQIPDNADCTFSVSFGQAGGNIKYYGYNMSEKQFWRGVVDSFAIYGDAYCSYGPNPLYFIENDTDVDIRVKNRMRGNMITVCRSEGYNENGDMLAIYNFSFDHYKTFSYIHIKEDNVSDPVHNLLEDYPDGKYNLMMSGPFAGYKIYMDRQDRKQ